MEVELVSEIAAGKGKERRESCKLYQGEQALTSPTGSYMSSVYSYRFN